MYSLYKSMVVLETSVASLSACNQIVSCIPYICLRPTIHTPTCGYHLDDGDLQFNSAKVT